MERSRHSIKEKLSETSQVKGRARSLWQDTATVHSHTTHITSLTVLTIFFLGSSPAAPGPREVRGGGAGGSTTGAARAGAVGGGWRVRAVGGGMGSEGREVRGGGAGGPMVETEIWDWAEREVMVVVVVVVDMRLVRTGGVGGGPGDGVVRVISVERVLTRMT